MKSIKIPLLNYDFICYDCISRFKLRKWVKTVEHSIVCIIGAFAVIVGIYTESWLVFLFLMFGVPVIADQVVRFKGPLVLGGVKARVRDKRTTEYKN
ncbi:hypothetical protein [Pseudoteredinibacter isoporae]|uniref:hypothetical protein n=1 Tax=Pseudoteredinibacter isoporae TaxID=570281 RepID=UPI001C86BF0B|nr:hypothetical protein [Pseudoteredinibacter isoporae]